MNNQLNRFSGVRLVGNSATRAGRGIGRSAVWCWHLLVQNRLAIAVASLVWLIFRSGTQPRRLSYPCQQVAAVNVSAFAAGLIPTLFLARRRHGPHALPRAVIIRRQLLIAGIMFLTALIGVETYQFAQTPETPVLPESGPELGDPVPSVVSIYRQQPAGGTYTTQEIETMVRQAVALAGGLSGVIQPGQSVGIKPNLVTDGTWSPSNPNGKTTDPRVVLAVVKLAQEAGAGSVKIIEGTASGSGGRSVTWNAYKNCGYDANSDHLFDYDTSVPLLDLNDAGTGGTVARPITSTPPNTMKITLTNGCIRFDYYIPKLVLKPSQGGTCDVLITVPTLKNHGQGAITLALKSHVGIAPNDIYYDTEAGYYPCMKRDLLHRWGAGDPFPRTVSGSNPPAPTGQNTCVQYTVVDLNLVRANDYVVVDGLVGVTDGPTGNGKPDPLLRLIMAGKDSVAVDSIGALIMRYDPLQIPQIQWAWNRGLGIRDTAWINVFGHHVSTVREPTDFPAGYGGSVWVEITPPLPGTMSLNEGQEVSGVVLVSITGESDNVAVTKAELYVDGTYQETDRTAPYSFNWDTTGLSPGPHTVTVTVYDAPLNEASVTCNVIVVQPEPVPGDFNGDRDVDQEDLDQFLACMSGANVPAGSGCDIAKFDADEDVDLEDYARFQGCLTGIDVEGDPDCAD